MLSKYPSTDPCRAAMNSTAASIAAFGAAEPARTSSGSHSLVHTHTDVISSCLGPAPEADTVSKEPWRAGVGRVATRIATRRRRRTEGERVGQVVVVEDGGEGDLAAVEHQHRRQARPVFAARAVEHERLGLRTQE